MNLKVIFSLLLSLVFLPIASTIAQDLDTAPQQGISDEDRQKLLDSLNEAAQKMNEVTRLEPQLHAMEESLNQASYMIVKLYFISKIGCDSDESCPQKKRDEIESRYAKVREDHPKEVFVKVLQDMQKECANDINCSTVQRAKIDDEFSRAERD